MTITSMRQEIRPRADDLFSQGPMLPPSTGPPPPSKPVDVPMRTLGGPSNTYNRAFSTVGQNMSDKYGEKDEFVSCSAPTTRFRPATPQGYDEYDQEVKGGEVGMGTGTGTGTPGDGDPGDDFEKLRLARERERNERQRINIARSISTTQGSNPTNLNVELVEALAASLSDDLNHSGA